MTTRRRASRIAALFVLPYLLLGLVWAISNPAGAVPDEGDHLVKALGMAHLDIGAPNDAPLSPDAGLGEIRNHSISRVVTIPARLNPAGLSCFAFKSFESAACQPAASDQEGTVQAATAVGAYPPFVYVPIGVAAMLGSSAADATRWGRIVVLALSTWLFWLACRHLVTWCGRRALIGAAIGVSPMVLFVMGALNTSAIEFFGAMCVATVVAAYATRPDSLSPTRTKLVLTAGAVCLVLSRQLGVVSLACLLGLLLVLGAWRDVVGDLRRGRRSTIISIALIGGVTAAVAVWELLFDHPAMVGPWVSSASLDGFWALMPDVVQQMVGRFGWADVGAPNWVNNAWICACVVLLALALVLGRWRDRIVLVAWLAIALIVAVVTYSRVFFPIDAGIQGRHLLPLLVLVPVWSGCVLARRRAVLVQPLFGLAAFVLPAVVAVGLWLNFKRYAVGIGPGSGPRWFPPVAQWTPPLGWYVWLVLLAGGCGLLAVNWLSLLRRDQTGPADSIELASTLPATGGPMSGEGVSEGEAVVVDGK